MTVQDDKRWSDKFLPEIRSILGFHLISEPPQEEDWDRNTDLMVMKMEPVRIGCRMRHHHHLEHYGDEFTIRTGRPSKIKTELAKVIEGWGDYFFYGFASSCDTRIEKWTLADMKVFRRTFMRMLVDSKPGEIPGISKVNTDNSSSFAAFRWDQFPPEFVVASSENQNPPELTEGLDVATSGTLL